MEKTREIHVSRSTIFGLLFLCFNFGFIITPYWLLPEQPVIKFLVLSGTILLGIIWAYHSASTVILRFNLRALPGLLVLLVVLIVMNLQPLSADIPWRGDEDLHISTVLVLISFLQPYTTILFIIGFLIFLFLLSKKTGYAIFFYSVIMLVIYCAFVVFRIFPLQELFLSPRYPFITYWISAILLKIPSIFLSSYHEEFYRLIPVLFTGVIIWLFIKASFDNMKIPAFLAGISVASIPVVYYYSSIFYLELPAVCLMFIVCLRIDHLLNSDFKEIRTEPGWYALILIGFIKETAIPFLLVFVVFRIALKIYRLIQGKQNSIKEKNPPEKFTLKGMYDVLSQEMAICFLLLFPAALYLIFRSSLGEITRGYVPSVNNLFHLSTYKVIIRSILEQFGPILVIFIAGCVLLIRQRKFLRVCFYLSTIVIFLIFFTADDWRFIGYSRFNLLILPEILACGVAVIHRLNGQKIIGPAISIIILAVNFVISPINFDGTKKPFWGNYNTDTSEHYYPYEETLQWIKDSGIRGPLLFTGLYYPYYFDFYFNKLNWFPVYKVIESEEGRNESKDILKMLAIGKEEKYTAVIYHILGKEIPTFEKDTGYAHEQSICNMAHCLLIFY
jgi:hypothetical protein